MKTELKPNENQNNNQNKTHQDVDVNVYVNNKIISFIESNFNRTISSYEYETLSTLQSKYGEELLLYALEKTLEANKRQCILHYGIYTRYYLKCSSVCIRKPNHHREIKLQFVSLVSINR